MTNQRTDVLKRLKKEAAKLRKQREVWNVNKKWMGTGDLTRRIHIAEDAIAEIQRLRSLA